MATILTEKTYHWKEDKNTEEIKLWSSEYEGAHLS